MDAEFHLNEHSDRGGSEEKREGGVQHTKRA